MKTITIIKVLKAPIAELPELDPFVGKRIEITVREYVRGSARGAAERPRSHAPDAGGSDARSDDSNEQT